LVAPNRTFSGLGVATLATACLLAGVSLSRAAEFGLESLGARAGFSLNPASREFYQVEAFANWTLPWAWDLGKDWSLQTRLDLSAGWLTDHGTDAAVGSLGPTLVLSHEPWPVSLDVGFSPTLISRHDFPEKDLGTAMQFTSHAALNWDFAPHWSLTYRFQHMSNAGLAASNPGLNLNFFGLSYRF
jgi:hypothetical protein